MSLYDDLFPTREGAATGSANERQMLDKVGAEGIRTELRTNADGSTTRLKTRSGVPEFVTDTPEPIDAQTFPRGFGARVPFGNWATLFDPTAWQVLAANYTPAKPTYFVMPKATSVNAKAAVATHWNDVLSWAAGYIRINGKDTQALSAKAVGVPETCLPFTLPAAPAATDATYYGTGRSHWVGAAAVYSLGSGGAVARTALIPETPRVEQRAQLSGFRIVGSEARLSELFYYPPSWGNGAWGVIGNTFTLAVGSATRTDSTIYAVDCGQPEIVLTGSDVYETRESFAIPPTHIYWTTTADITQTGVDPRTGKTVSVTIGYMTTGSDVTAASEGACVWDNHVTNYDGAASGTFSLGEHTVSWTAAGHKDAGTHFGYIIRDASTYALPAVHGAVTRSTYNYNYGWSTDGSPGLPYNRPGGTISLIQLGPLASQGKNTENYTASATLAVDGRQVLMLTAEITSDWGSAVVFNIGSPVNANEGGIVASGFVDVYQPLYFGNPPEDWLQWRDGVIASESAQMGSGISTYLNDLNVIDGNGVGALVPYTVTTSDYAASSSSVSWATCDYWYYDEAEQVFGYIRGQFSASGSSTASSGTLNVFLGLTWQGATAEQQLCSVSLDLGPLLPTVDGFLPPPKLRAMFAPKFKTQGVFPGAAYTTAAEAAAGAVPHCLMSFNLQLAGYEDVGGEDESTPISNNLTVVPFMLVEMLYAYVYSNKYGLDPDVAYPASRTGAITALAKKLFGPVWAINYHNGAFANWKNSVDSRFNNYTTVEVFRT